MTCAFAKLCRSVGRERMGPVVRLRQHKINVTQTTYGPRNLLAETISRPLRNLSVTSEAFTAASQVIATMRIERRNTEAMAHTTFKHATRAAAISALILGTLLVPAATASARQWD